VNALHLKPDRERLDLRGRVLEVDDFLQRIQDDAMRKMMKTEAHRLPGRYRIDDRIHVAEGEQADFAWCPIDKDELLNNYDLPLPEKNRWQLQELRRNGIDFDRLFIVHELPERGYKQQIEHDQHIPIELIAPISKQEHARQVAALTGRELARRSRPYRAQLAATIKWSAPKLAMALAVCVATVVTVAVISAIVYMVLAMLATIAVGAILVIGVAAGAGVDPILIGAIDEDDGTSRLYYLTHYSYPVRKPDAAHDS
jgi:hypothetical protein